MQTYQKFMARFRPSVTLGKDFTSCHQKEGIKRTSPSSTVQFIGYVSPKSGNLFQRIKKQTQVY